jgi:PAS domain S-box-containing protein
LLERWKSFLLDRRSAPRAEGEIVDRPPLWQMPLLAVIMFALIIAGAGSAIYLSAKGAVTQSTHDNLETIAKLKSGEIERWLDGHGKDAQLAINTSLFTVELQRWQKGGMRDNSARDRLLEHLKKVSMAGHYRDVSIRAAADGALLLSSSGRLDAEPYRANAVIVARKMKSLLDDLHLDLAGSADIDLDFYLPISQPGSSEALGVVHIQDSPLGFLFPQMGRWPGSSTSAEILLFRRDGESLFFLNSPRHLENAMPHLRVPVGNPEFLATKAAAGQVGPLLGFDYQGVPSLGYALPVAGTSWLMIAKVNAAEAYELLNMAALFATVATIALLFLATWWMFQHSRNAEARYRHGFQQKLLLRRIDFLSRNANDIMIMTDLNGAIIEANDRFSAVYGYSHEATIGMNVAELSLPSNHVLLAGRMKRLTARECLVYESENIHRDGHVFPVESSARMIEIDGKCYFQWIVRDVSERKRMENALRASEERFRQAFDHAPIGMAMVGLDGHFLTVNSAICHFTGYSQPELTAMTLGDITYPVDPDNSLASAVDAGSGGYSPVVKMAIHKDGRILYLSINRTMVRKGDGSPLYVLYQIQDITEHKDATTRIQRLSQLKAATSETNRAIIHSGSPAEVYRAVCQACVEHGNFWLAWIGLADPDTQSITPVEVAGPAAGYLDGAVISARSDVPEGQWPSAMAYRERRVYICNDFSAGPINAPWRDRAAAYCLSSSIALPIQRGGKPYGSLTVYGPEKNLFDDESEALLRTMAENISFAIDQFDREEQRRQSENDLRHSEEKFRTLVENLPQSVFVKDAGSVYVSCNIAYARGLGITPDKISGMTDFDFYPKELAEKYQHDDRKVLDSGKVEDIHEDHIEQGQQRFVHTIKAPVRNERGEIVGVLGMFSDVTESKRAEMALKQYADEVEDLYQNAPCGYHSITSDGTLARMNSTELRWLGYAREEVVCRMTILDILAPASRHVFIERFSLFKKTGVMQELELEMLRKDRTTLPVVLSATAVFDADGKYIFSRTTVFDITERRKLEADQRKQAKRLEELSYRLVAVQEEERRRLAAELHDRASPNLAAIKITFGNLADSLPASVLAEAESCLADVRALLDDTTVGIREICTELRPTVLDYTGLIPALEGYAAQFMKRTGVVVCMKTPDDAIRLPKNIESVLFRIVQEALTNCAKHACAKSVEIELACSVRQVTLLIKDDGFGFDPDVLGQSGQISGLGLITMKERAEFVGGKFSVTSHPLMGTEIRVELGSQSFSGCDRANPPNFENMSVHLLPGPGSSSLN